MLFRSEELGVDYEYAYVDMLTGERKETVMNEIESLNPQGGFPVMVVNKTKVITGSDLFALCLLMPHDAIERYKIDNNIKKWNLDSIRIMVSTGSMFPTRGMYGCTSSFAKVRGTRLSMLIISGFVLIISGIIFFVSPQI